MTPQYRLSEFGGDIEIVDNNTGWVECVVGIEYKEDMERYVEYLNGKDVDDRLGAVEK
jgi:transcription initiation factor IIE alpha subunit